MDGMRRIRKAAPLVFLTLGAAVLLSGCLQSQTTIKVGRNGSGEVERTFVMKHEIVEMLAGMSGTAPADFDLYEDGELEAEAASMGSDVTLRSVENINDSFGRGYRAIFAFDDINNLRVNQNPGDAVPSGDPGESSEELVTFALTRGNPARLVVMMPQAEEDEADDLDTMDDEGAPTSEELEGMTEFYRDMRIGFDIEVEGSIVDTNATHRSGNTITLMDIDFNQILADPEATRRLIENQVDSLVEVQDLVKNTEGISVEFKEEVSVRFR
jgi:hypothetical protein